jgi:hypothetical protein
MKGYYVRKFKIPYKKLKNKMIEDYVLKTINSLIEVFFLKITIIGQNSSRYSDGNSLKQ